MTENERLIGMFMENLIELDDLPPELRPRKPRPKKLRQPKRPSLAEIAKHGLEVRVAADGSFVIAAALKSNAVPVVGNDLDQWLEEHRNANTAEGD